MAWFTAKNPSSGREEAVESDIAEDIGRAVGLIPHQSKEAAEQFCRSCDLHWRQERHRTLADLAFRG